LPTVVWSALVKRLSARYDARLTEEEAGALARLLRRTIDDDRQCAPDLIAALCRWS
jgi:hypothetical protein